MTETSSATAKKDIQKLQRAIVDGLEDVKAQDIQVFDTEHITSLFERVIVASGSSNRQTKALAASVRDAVREAGFGKPRIEGEENGEWIVVDCGAAVAHIMQPSIRQYYHLEELWGDKPVKLKLGATAPLVKASRAAALAAAQADAKQQPAGRTATRTAARNAAKKAAAKQADTGAAKKPAAKAPAKAAAKAAGKTAPKTATKTATKTTAKTAIKTAAASAPAAKKVAAKRAPAPATVVKSVVAKKPAAAKKVVASKPAVKTPAAKRPAAKKTSRSA
jgi:ribosome-associated protein